MDCLAVLSLIIRSASGLSCFRGLPRGRLAVSTDVLSLAEFVEVFDTCRVIVASVDCEGWEEDVVPL